MPPSAEALALWQSFRDGPKQIDMPIDQCRQAGEQAEAITSEPHGVRYLDAPDVRGLWAVPNTGVTDTTILYVFGGGYVLGSPQSRRKTAGHLAIRTGARVLVPNYRLAPEHRYPAAVDDVLGAYRFLRAGVDSSAPTVLAGDSAGGGLAIALAVAIRDADEPRPSGVVALSPWVDLTCSGESMQTRGAWTSNARALACWRWRSGTPGPTICGRRRRHRCSPICRASLRC